MYKMSNFEIDRLHEEFKGINDRVIESESDLKEWQSGTNPFVSIDDIHLLEEQLHYMRGYHRLLRIRLAQQGIKA